MIRRPGTAPDVLLSQVRNTAGWLLQRAEDPASAGDSDTVVSRWSAVRAGWNSLMATWDTHDGRLLHFDLMLLCHLSTVDTFIPTDVDSRVRHHVWWEQADAAALARTVERLAWTAWLDPHTVSARVLDTKVGPLSGHQGELLAMRAGALGRALALDARPVIDALVDDIDSELRREAAILSDVRETAGAEVATMHAATLASHNVGDLSRVVEEWPVRTEASRALRERFVKLGESDPTRHAGAFVFAGAINKSTIANETHRFLPLRRAHGLRRSSDLLLPIAPWLDRWGERVARHPALDADARAEIFAALVEGHDRDPTHQSYLRACAGMHGALAGGIDGLIRDLPARQRKRATTGPMREALRLSTERFEARMIHRYRLALNQWHASVRG